MTDSLRIAVVEDEETQRRQLVRWIADAPGADLVGEFADGEAAVRGIDGLMPDVVLLDVALPVITGLEVLKRIKHSPEVVFTTAYRDHAVAAFEIGAADYLLKPFRRERLIEALERVRARRSAKASGSAGVPPLADRVSISRDTSHPLERLFVRDRGAIVPVAIGEVERIETDGDYSAVITATRRFLVAVPLAELHARIQKPDFVRVHRGHVVNLAQVKRIVPGGDGRLRVEMRSSGFVLASRSGSQQLRELVE